MINKKFNVRLQLTELTYTSIDFLKYNLDILQNESNIKVNIVFWYDKNKMDISPIYKKHIATLFDIPEEHIYSSYPKNIFRNALFNISYSTATEQLQALSSVEPDSKFYLFYDTESSFVKNIVELFSFIKAKLNYEVSRNENRYSRK